MDMQYRRLGKSGRQVRSPSFGSRVSFSNQMEVAEMLADDLMAEIEIVLDNKPDPMDF